MKMYDKEKDSFKSVPIDNDHLEIGQIIAGQAESSEYMGKVYVDFVDICCVGNIYEKTSEQRSRIEKYDKLYNEM